MLPGMRSLQNVDAESNKTFIAFTGLLGFNLAFVPVGLAFRRRIEGVPMCCFCWGQTPTGISILQDEHRFALFLDI
jgi:hypothetical protein